MVKYYYKLNDSIILRKEYFGGLVFNKENGNTIDVDRELYILLLLLENNDGLLKEEIRFLLAELDIAVSKAALTGMVKELVKLKIIKYKKVEQAIRELEGLKYNLDLDWPRINHLKAPETVHWAATYSCNANCPDCYARRHRGKFQEMDLREVKVMLDSLVKEKVFQLAIGGGEALIRDNIIDIIAYAKNAGLVVHFTTGLDNLDHVRIKELSSHLTSIQLGIQPDRMLSDSEYLDRLQLLYLMIRETGIYTGVNLVLTKTVINRFPYIIKLLVEIGFERIVILRYKPHDNQKRWLKENVTPEKFIDFESVLKEVLEEYRDINFRLDCALSFLQRKIDPVTAGKAGIRGCTAADRIIAIGPDGSIYPCLQLIDQSYKAGNILEDDLSVIIQNSQTLRRYREFRDRIAYWSSICGICKANQHCGGCRVFSNDTKKEDISCPEPLIGDLKICGKYGRRGDLKHYFKTNNRISVGGYMERYGVGQSRAVKELKNTDWLVKENVYQGGHFRQKER